VAIESVHLRSESIQVRCGPDQEARPLSSTIPSYNSLVPRCPSLCPGETYFRHRWQGLVDTTEPHPANRGYSLPIAPMRSMSRHLDENTRFDLQRARHRRTTRSWKLKTRPWRWMGSQLGFAILASMATLKSCALPMDPPSRSNRPALQDGSLQLQR